MKHALNFCVGFAAFLICMFLDPYLFLPLRLNSVLKFEKAAWGLVPMSQAVFKMAAAMFGY